VFIGVLSFVVMAAASSELHGFVRSKVGTGDESMKFQDETSPSKLLPSVSRRAETTGTTPVGAVVAGEKEFPFFVDWGGCGGSLIHEDIVLSAAHCQEERDNDVYVGAFETQEITGWTEKRRIETNRVHPNYVRRKAKFDFMLLKLNSPSTLSTIELNSDPDQPSEGELLTAMGHGQTEMAPFSKKLLKVTVPRVSDKDCEESYPRGSLLKREFSSESMMCAGFLLSGVNDTCQGDSGGPLVEKRRDNKSEHTIQVGITSWGNGCGLPGSPGVYAKVSSAKDWIDEQICILSSNPPPKMCNTRARFYGQLQFVNRNSALSKRQRKVLRGAEVRLYRVIKATNGKRRHIRVKHQRVNKDGTWVIPLKSIHGGKYYIKVVLNDKGFVFIPKTSGSYSDVNEQGKSKSVKSKNIKPGNRFEVNAEIAKNGNRIVAPVEVEAPVSYSVHVNVGGPDYADRYRTVWAGYQKVSSYSSGKSLEVAHSTLINGTDIQDLYHSELWFAQKKVGDPPMIFEVPVPRGVYHVRLHFAEVYRKAQKENTRVFDVFIEDSLVWKELDIFKEAGGGYTALVKESEAMVDDCLLTVEFKKVMGNPKLCAIDICTITTVDFKSKADGSPIEPGLYKGDEWLEYGMIVWPPGRAKDRGSMLFDFVGPVSAVYELGFLDVDDGTSVEVSHVTEKGVEETVLELELLGDSSEQILKINIENITQVKVVCKNICVVTHIKFCYYDEGVTTALAVAQSQCPAAFPAKMASDAQTPDSLHAMHDKSVGLP